MGWGIHGDPAPRVLTGGRHALDGERALRLKSSRSRPVYVIQDVPLATRGFVLRLPFLRERGSQTVLLLSGWNRGDPQQTVASLRIDLGPQRLLVTTAAGRFRINHRIPQRQWTVLEIVADPRVDLLDISLNGEPLATVPGVPLVAPQTLVLGASDRGRGRYLYDSLRLVRLAEIELESLRRAAEAELPRSLLPHLANRLDGALLALSSGSPRLAIPEMRAAARLVARWWPKQEATATGPRRLTDVGASETATRITELLLLLEAS